MSNEREPFNGRYFSIINVESEDPGGVSMFWNREAAEAYLAQCRALPEDDDNHMTEYHHVLPVDVVGVMWNSFDPDPRASNPLSPEEVIAAYRGDP